MKKTRFFSSLIATALLAWVPAAALNAVELRFLNWEGRTDALHFANKGGTVAIQADENPLSPAYIFEDAGPLVLFKDVVIEGKTVRVPAGTLAVPADLTHAIVVLSAIDKAPNTYAGAWIDNSPTARPARTALLINRSHYPVAFKMDSTELTLAPNGTHQFSFSSNAESRVVVQASAQVNGKWDPIFGNPLPVRSGLRVLLLLRDGRPQPGSKTNLVDILSFYDRPPALPAAQTSAQP